MELLTRDVSCTTSGCCCCFVVVSGVACGQQLELLPGGLHGVLAGGTPSEMERLLREAREGKGKSDEERREGE